MKDRNDGGQGQFRREIPLFFFFLFLRGNIFWEEPRPILARLMDGWWRFPCYLPPASRVLFSLFFSRNTFFRFGISKIKDFSTFFFSLYYSVYTMVSKLNHLHLGLIRLVQQAPCLGLFNCFSIRIVFVSGSISNCIKSAPLHNLISSPINRHCDNGRQGARIFPSRRKSQTFLFFLK